MAIKVGINGFGRIGRQVLRIALSNKDIEVVAINDIADLKTCSQLLKYDSIFGVLNADIDLLDDGISIDGKKVRFFSEMSPSDIKWTDEKCDIVIESTGIFTTQEKASMHLGGTVKKVVISAPASGDVDLTTVMGANEKDGPYVYWKDGKIVRDESKGRGGSHGRPWEYKVVVREKNHPITRGLPTEFLMVKEELYDRLRGPAKNMTVLATALAEGGSERHEPVLMTISYGKGRVFHTVMGHSHTSMGGVAFQETLIRGTEWAATGEVTFPPVNNKVLPVNRAAYRKVEDIKSLN